MVSPEIGGSTCRYVLETTWAICGFIIVKVVIVVVVVYRLRLVTFIGLAD